MTLPVRFEDVLAASRGLAGRIRHTPLLPFGALSEKVGIPVFLKAESLQRGGAFKIRGALNAVAAALARGERPKGSSPIRRATMPRASPSRRRLSDSRRSS